MPWYSVNLKLTYKISMIDELTLKTLILYIKNTFLSVNYLK